MSKDLSGIKHRRWGNARFLASDNEGITAETLNKHMKDVLRRGSQWLFTEVVSLPEYLRRTKQRK